MLAGLAALLALVPAVANQLHGVVFNQAQSVTASRVEEALTTLFYTGDHLVNGNVLISAAKPTPAGATILFRYDGELIGRINENRRWITRESIERFAGDLYRKIQAIDRRKRSEILRRLRKTASARGARGPTAVEK